MILNINEQINPWISSIDVENNQEYLNNILNIGYNISKSVKLEDTNQNIMKYLTSTPALANLLIVCILNYKIFKHNLKRYRLG